MTKEFTSRKHDGRDRLHPKLPFDVVPAEMQVTKNNPKSSKVLHRDKEAAPPSRAEATSFSEYVAQQPHHVRRFFRHCDLSEITKLRLVTLIRSSGSFYVNTTEELTAAY